MTPKIRAYRILKAMDRYIDLESEKLPSYLKPCENQIGIYENERGVAYDAILITDTGFEVLGAVEEPVSFAEISKVELPVGEKMDIDHLLVFTKNSNDPIIVPIHGKKERTRDVFEFLRFFKRCLADMKTE